jgi:hypothetical protein
LSCLTSVFDGEICGFSLTAMKAFADRAPQLRRALDRCAHVAPVAVLTMRDETRNFSPIAAGGRVRSCEDHDGPQPSRVQLGLASLTMPVVLIKLNQ